MSTARRDRAGSYFEIVTDAVDTVRSAPPLPHERRRLVVAAARAAIEDERSERSGRTIAASRAAERITSPRPASL